MLQNFMESITAKPLPSLHQFPRRLQMLVRSLYKTQNFVPQQIKDCVDHANISVDDLMPWADFSHPVADGYGRKLVFHGGYFEVMVMSWLPGDYSAIHDHGVTQWGAVQSFGTADHYIYSYRQGVLTTLRSAHYSPGIIHEVDNELIHQMGNPGDVPFLSLHVYGCAHQRESITGNARIFDLAEQSIQYTDGGVFFCLPDDLIKQRHRGLQGDTETTLRHHQQMRDRIQRILITQDSPQLRERLNQLNREILKLTTLLSDAHL